MSFLFGFFIISVPILFIVVFLAFINFPSFLTSKEENITKHISYVENLVFELETIEGRVGFKQLNRLKYKTHTLNNVLKTKFKVNEVTYIKYMDSINKVYSVFLKNLEKYHFIIKNIKILDEKTMPYSRNNAEKKRDYLIENMSLEADKLLFQNEKALFKLDVLEAGISSISGFNYRKVNRVREYLIKLSKKIHGEKFL
jgi:hypothetical protein